MPIPLVASRHWRERFGNAEYIVTKQVRVYPTLFAELRLRIVSPNRTIGPEFLDLMRESFTDHAKLLKGDVSNALFGDRHAINHGISGHFTIDVRSPSSLSHSHPSRERQAPIVKLASLDRSKRIQITSSTRLLTQRVVDATALALAQRVVVPVLWASFENGDLDRPSVMRELAECILISQLPEHYVYSKKLSPHILPWSYQRRVFEAVAKVLKLFDMERDLTRKMAEWLRGVPVTRALFLLDCSYPVAQRMRSTLRRLAGARPSVTLKPPVETVLKYLVLAYLRDQYLMEEDPQRYRIPEDRYGVRTANQIRNGVLELERQLEITPRHKKEDFYPIPGKALESLMRVGLVNTVTMQRTSSRLGFRINPENAHVLRLLIDTRTSFDSSKIRSYGV